MAVGRAPRNVRKLRRDVRDAHRVADRGQQLDDGPPAGGVALVDPPEADLDELVQGASVIRLTPATLLPISSIRAPGRTVPAPRHGGGAVNLAVMGESRMLLCVADGPTPILLVMRLSLILVYRRDDHEVRSEGSTRLGTPAGLMALATLVGVARCSSAGARPVPQRAVRSPGVDQRRRAPRTSTPTCSARSGASTSQVSSILNNPNTDPHTFEASTSVARRSSQAELIVQNGVGYDSFMNNIESASPNAGAQGHRGPARARAARQHPESAPLVQPEDDAGGGQGHGHRPLGARARATRRTSRPDCGPSTPRSSRG